MKRSTAFILVTAALWGAPAQAQDADDPGPSPPATAAGAASEPAAPSESEPDAPPDAEQPNPDAADGEPQAERPGEAPRTDAAGPDPVGSETAAPAAPTGHPPAANLRHPATGSSGLGGFLDLVDARAGAHLQAGATLRILHTRARLSGDVSGFRVETEESRFTFNMVGGVALFDVIELGLRLPVVDLDQSFRVPTAGIDRIETKTGAGDLRFSAKASLSLDLLSLAAYVHAEPPTGSATFANTAEVELGGAATAALLDGRLAFHLDLAFVDVEGGTQAFRYRLGVSGVPLQGPGWAVQPFFYADGVELEGPHGSDVTLVWGSHVFVGEHLFFEVGGSLRVRERSVRDLEDEGTAGLQVAIGYLARF